MEDPPFGSETRVTATILIGIPRERIAIPIYLDEWDELVERIESCKVSLQPWSMVYSVAFAAGVTAGLSILPIAFADLPSWVMTVYIVVCSLGIGVGTVCTIAERKFAKIQHSQIDDLVSHMERIKQPFSDPSTQQQG